MQDGLYPVEIPSNNTKVKGGMQAYLSRQKTKDGLIAEWHRKLGHPHADRYFNLCEMHSEIPNFDRIALKNYQCIPCLTAKAKRAPVRSSTRRTSRPLELVHLDISGKIEESPAGREYTVVFLV